VSFIWFVSFLVCEWLNFVGALRSAICFWVGRVGRARRVGLLIFKKQMPSGFALGRCLGFPMENCFRKALDVSQSRALHSPVENCFRKALQVKFMKPLSHASRASHTSHFAICLARSPMPRPAECKARSSVKWGCALRVVERLPLFCDSVVKDQFGSSLCHFPSAQAHFQSERSL